MKNKGVILALIVVCILSLVVVLTYIGNDKKGPEMSIDKSKVVKYSSEQDESVLTKCVKAVDDKDGDVSSSVIVESIYVMSDLTSVNVSFAARDKSNNVSKLSYVFEYEASEEEKNAKNNTSETEEVINGTTAASATTVAGTTTKAEETETASTEEVTTEAVTVAGGPMLVLKATEATINRGAAFNIASYISTITDDKDTSDALARRVIVNGDYSTATAGDYTIDVYCTDTDRHESNHVAFVLHVK